MGSLLTREYLHARLRPEVHRQNSMEAVKRVGLDQLKQQLNLTSDQEKIVTRELDVYAKYYQNIEEQRADIEEQRANVSELGRQKILDVLNDDQKKRFNRLFGPGAHP